MSNPRTHATSHQEARLPLGRGRNRRRMSRIRVSRRGPRIRRGGEPSRRNPRREPNTNRASGPPRARQGSTVRRGPGSQR